MLAALRWAGTPGLFGVPQAGAGPTRAPRAHQRPTPLSSSPTAACCAPTPVAACRPWR
jgi:hypothetical protein